MVDAQDIVEHGPELRAAIEVTSRRAWFAMLGIGAVGLFDGGIRLPEFRGQMPSRFTDAAIYGLSWLARIPAAVLFGRWLYRAYQDNRRLHGAPPGFSPRHAVASFYIPVVQIWRPYQVMRNLFRASNPSDLPYLLQYKATENVTYRASASERIAPVAWDRPSPPIRAWWAFYAVFPAIQNALTPLTVSFVVAHRDAINTLTPVWFGSLDVVSAVLVIVVIRAIQVRQGERLRRLEGSRRTLVPAAAV